MAPAAARRFAWPISGCVLLGSLVTCGAPVEPTSTGLVIRMPADAIKIAEHMQLGAVVNGKPVSATWESSDPSVVTIDRAGGATGLTSGAARITAATNSMSVSVTIRVVPDHGGTWKGLMTMTSCQRITGRGPLTDCQPGNKYQIALTITQSGERADGTIDLFHESTTGPVTGTVNEQGELALQGTARNVQYQAQFTIVMWRTSLSESGARMAGVWTSDSVFANGFGLQHQREEYDLTHVVKQAP